MSFQLDSLVAAFIPSEAEGLRRNDNDGSRRPERATQSPTDATQDGMHTKVGDRCRATSRELAPLSCRLPDRRNRLPNS